MKSGIPLRNKEVPFGIRNHCSSRSGSPYMQKSNVGRSFGSSCNILGTHRRMSIEGCPKPRRQQGLLLRIYIYIYVYIKRVWGRVGGWADDGVGVRLDDPVVQLVPRWEFHPLKIEILVQLVPGWEFHPLKVEILLESNPAIFWISEGSTRAEMARPRVEHCRPYVRRRRDCETTTVAPAL